MSNDLWIGIIASIPVSIASGLLVEPVRTWFKNKGKSRAEARLELLQWEYRQVLFYVANAHSFTHYLLNSVARSVFGLSFLVSGAVYSGLSLWIASSHKIAPDHIFRLHDKIFSGTMLLVGAFCLFAAGFFITGIGRAISYYQKVSSPVLYFDKVPYEIRNRAAELEAVTIQDNWIPPDQKATPSTSSSE